MGEGVEVTEGIVGTIREGELVTIGSTTTTTQTTETRVEEEGQCRGDEQSSVRRSSSSLVARVVEVPPNQFLQFALLGI